MKRTIYSLILLSLTFSSLCYARAAPWIGETLNELNCTGRGQGYGPFDYTQTYDDKYQYKIKLVERFHFTYEVEGLIKGHKGYLTDDLDYTLRAWPNHHRALKSIMRYQLEVNAKVRKGKLASPVECYFQRAINFSPKDTTALYMYGYFLKKSGHLKKAKKIYQKALEIVPKNRKIAYSYSFLLIDLNEYKEALKYALLAYEKGKAPNKLKNKLKKLGVWKGAEQVREIQKAITNQHSEN